MDRFSSLFFCVFSYIAVKGYDHPIPVDENPYITETTYECYAKQCLGMTIDYENIKCSGLASCKEGFLTAWADVLCSGFESCKLTQIITTDSQHSLTCSGSFSCAESNIYAHSVYATGRFSLQSSIIDSIGKSEIYVESYGYHGGEEGMLFCREGSKCTIDCSTDGCYNFQVFCEPGSECIVHDDCINNQDVNKQFVDETNSDQLSFCPIFNRDEDAPIDYKIDDKVKLKLNELDEKLFDDITGLTMSYYHPNKISSKFAQILFYISISSLIIIAMIFCYRSVNVITKNRLQQTSDDEYTVLIH